MSNEQNEAVALKAYKLASAQNPDYIAGITDSATANNGVVDLLGTSKQPSDQPSRAQWYFNNNGDGTYGIVLAYGSRLLSGVAQGYSLTSKANGDIILSTDAGVPWCLFDKKNTRIYDITASGVDLTTLYIVNNDQTKQIWTTSTGQLVPLVLVTRAMNPNQAWSLSDA